MATTGIPAPAGDTLTAPDEPGAGWFSAPDYTRMQALGPLYDGINAAADGIHMPRGTLWLLLAGISAVGLAGLAYLVGKKHASVGAITLLVILALQWMSSIMQGWFFGFALIVVVPALVIHRRE